MDPMIFSFAPMEGITGRIFRNTFNRYFGGVDYYYTPFIQPNIKKALDRKVLNDIDPGKNTGISLIPQIMTNNSGLFIKASKELAELGYDTVNLNLGCPSRTVSSKGKGAGFLAYPDELDRFLEDIFSGCSCRISIKSRIGIKSEDEFPVLLDIYNKYPYDQLILHPRLLRDYYSGPVHTRMYELAYNKDSSRICYNGEISGVSDFEDISAIFPKTHSFMIGRGLLKNPNLMHDIKHDRELDRNVLHEYVNELLENYLYELGDETSALFRMKEIWSYLAKLFTDSEPCAKKIRKAERLPVYKGAVEEIFSRCGINECR